jgi:hypothetical protein
LRQMNESQWRSIAVIFAEAAKSPMGVFTLMVLGVLVLGYAFFRASLLKYRLTVFILIFLGATGFAGTVLKEWLRTQTAVANSSAAPIPPARLPTPSDAQEQPDRPTAPAKAMTTPALPRAASVKSGLPSERKLPDSVARARTFNTNRQFAEACRSYLEAVTAMGLENDVRARKASRLYEHDQYVDAVEAFESVLSDHEAGGSK